MSAPFLSRQGFVAPITAITSQYCREMIFLSRVVPVRGDRDYPPLLQHWQNKITRTNLGEKMGYHYTGMNGPGIWILGLCLSREVIVLLLLSCCDGINDQDKTIILLPSLYTSHHPKKRVYCSSKRETMSTSLHSFHFFSEDKTQNDPRGNEKYGLSALLFYGNKRVRAIFFYYLDIIRAVQHSSTRSRELSSVLQDSLIFIYLDKHRVTGLRRSESRREPLVLT